MYSVIECATYAGVRNEEGSACCASSCGTCGGLGCDRRPGGAANCCIGQITEVCGSGQDAPCVTRGKSHCTIYNIKKISFT